MKRIAMLTLVMMMALMVAAPGLATNIEITNETTGGADDTIINYTVTASFTVTIPAEFTITTSSQEKSVSVTAGGRISYGKQLKITAESDNPGTNDEFQIADISATANKFPYEVRLTSASGTEVKSGDVILEYSAGMVNTGGSVALFFKLVNEPTIAGTYQDTVTFTISVEDAP